MIQDFKIEIFPTDKQIIRIDHLLKMYPEIFNISLRFLIAGYKGEDLIKKVREAGNKYYDFGSIKTIVLNYITRNTEQDYYNNKNLSFIKVKVTEYPISITVAFNKKTVFSELLFGHVSASEEIKIIKSEYIISIKLSVKNKKYWIIGKQRVYIDNKLNLGHKEPYITYDNWNNSKEIQKEYENTLGVFTLS